MMLRFEPVLDSVAAQMAERIALGQACAQRVSIPLCDWHAQSEVAVELLQVPPPRRGQPLTLTHTHRAVTSAATRTTPTRARRVC